MGIPKTVLLEEHEERLPVPKRTIPSRVELSHEGPVIYRSDAKLWPPGLDKQPLNPSQRRELCRIARDHGVRINEVHQDLVAAEFQVESFKKVCAGKSAIEKLCKELHAEKKMLEVAWQKRVEEW